VALENFNPQAPLIVSYQHYYILAVLLFVIGFLTVITRRNIVVVLMGLELMLAADNLLFLTFGNAHGITITRVVFSSLEQVQSPIGQMFMIFITIVAAAEVAVGLAIAISYYRLKASPRPESYRELHD